MKFWDELKHVKVTRPLNDLVDGCLTFAKSDNYLESIQNIKLSIHIIVPHSMDISKFPSNIKVYQHDDVKNIFIQLHNKINEYKKPKSNYISELAVIDPTAVIGVPGNNITKMRDGRIINMKHMGNVVIEDYAEVQALSVVHRSVFGSTIIRRNAQIFAKVNIGHNCDIGESTIVCPGSLLAGGTKVGKNCYIWQGVITRSNISICDNVIIGAGSLVLKDINKSGVYVGTPAKYIKEYKEDIR